MAFGKGHHLHLIDGSAFIFRAYHALPPLTRKSDGLPVGAVAGFCNMLQRYVENNTGPDAPTHVAVIFDHSGKTFRNDMYDLYKANRSATPEDLIPQFNIIREAIDAFGLDTDNKRLIRLFFQPPLVIWALWSTNVIRLTKKSDKG